MNDTNGTSVGDQTSGILKALRFSAGGDMNEFSTTHKETGIAEEKTVYRLEDFDRYRVTKEKDIPYQEPTIKIAGAPVAAPGNLTGISAAAKAGKTAVKSVAIAGAISKDGEIDGFQDLEVKPNPEGKAVIDFDTEQSEADQQYNVITALKRAGFTKTPDYFRSYNIRQLSLGDYQSYTDNICDLCAEKFGGIHSIFIDGGADYIASVNDEAAAYNIVQYFIHLSIKYNCPVIVIVHQNPGSDKERGHFGSEIQRKCYGLLSVTKNGDISTLQPKIMRKAGNGDIPLINYQYSKERGYHIQIDVADPADTRAIKEREKLKTIAENVFAPPNSLRHKDAINKIMDVTSKKLTSAKSMLSDMEGFGYVIKGEDDNYRINMDKVKMGQNGSK